MRDPVWKTRVSTIAAGLSICLTLMHPGAAIAETEPARGSARRPMITQELLPHGIQWHLPPGAWAADLEVATASGVVFAHRYQGSESVLYDLRAGDGAALADGSYQFELWLRTGSESSGRPAPPAAMLRRSGRFEVSDGALLSAIEPDDEEEALSAAPWTVGAEANQAVDGDLYVNGGICAGCEETAGDVPNGRVNAFVMCAGAGCTTAAGGGEALTIKGASPYIRFDDLGITDWYVRAAGEGTIFEITDSGLPFADSAIRMRIDSGDGLLKMDTNGKVGLGTFMPDAELHVVGTGLGGNPAIHLEETTEGYEWQLRANEAGFRVADQTASTVPLYVQKEAPTDSLRIDSLGNVGVGTATPSARLHVVGGARIEGDVALGSSRTRKREIAPADTGSVLGRLARIPIFVWQYDDQPGVGHIGPMAEDFGALFGPSPDARELSLVDSSGVALASIQALHERQLELISRLESLEARLAAAERENGALRRALAGALRPLP